MPRNPNSPHNPGCGPTHIHTSASENIKLQIMMSKLEDSLKDEFVLKENLKTINSESLLVLSDENGDRNIDIKSIDKIEKTSEGLVDTYTIYFINNAEPYSFTVTNGAKGEKGDTGEQGPAGKDGLTTAIRIGEIIYAQNNGTIDLPEFLTEHQSLAEYAKKTELFSKDYNDLINKPEIPKIPTNVSTFVNDAGYLTQQDISNLATKDELPNLEEYATKTEVSSQITTTAITTDQLVSGNEILIFDCGTATNTIK